MGGMSSLSFDNLFPAESEGSAGHSPALPAAGAKRSPVVPHERTIVVLPERRTFSAASPWALSLTRRILDFAVALTALVAFFPLMLVSAVLVRFGSEGPIFFRQRRLGRNGKEFTLYKFRSMKPVDGTVSGITVVGDSRITGVGGFLRRYKLDELPQFWNVLKGEMSLVGPRPKLARHEALHMACCPGITGVATLAFRKEEELLSGIPAHELDGFYEQYIKPAKAKMDRDYMRTATFGSDLRVLWQTATSCLFGSDDSVVEPAAVVAQYAAAQSVGTRVPSSHVALPHPLSANAMQAPGLQPEL